MRRGPHLSPLGLGVASLGNYASSVTLDRALATIKAAYEAGIRYFDVAPLYGHGLAEHRLGMALHEFGLTDVVISTKVGRILDPAPHGNGDFKTAFVNPLPFTYHYDYSYDGIMRSFEDSLQRLGRAKIDVLYIHNIDTLLHDQATCDALFRTCMNDGYRALEKLRAEGVISAIGVGNNSWEMCRRFLDAGDFDLFLLANGYNLLDQTAKAGFLDHCIGGRARVVMGAPFASGILATDGASNATYRYEPPPTHIVERVRSIAKIGARHGVTVAAAALQFPLANPAARSVIPSMISPEQVAANCAAFAQPIPDEFWAELKSEHLLPDLAVTPAAGRGSSGVGR